MTNAWKYVFIPCVCAGIHMHSLLQTFPMLLLIHRFLRKIFPGSLTRGWKFSKTNLQSHFQLQKEKKIEIHKKESYSSSSAVDTIIIRLMKKK